MDLTAAFREAEGSMHLDRAFAGERCNGITLFTMPPAEAAKFIRQIDKAHTALDLEKYRKKAIHQADFGFHLDYIAGCIEAAKMGFPEGLSALIQTGERLDDPKTKGYVLSSLLLANGTTVNSAINRSAVSKAADAAARMRLAQVALSVERSCLSHTNSVPESLTELVPGLLTVLTRRSVRWRLTQVQEIAARWLRDLQHRTSPNRQRGVPRPRGRRRELRSIGRRWCAVEGLAI